MFARTKRTNVILQAESRFLAVQEERRQKQQAMEAVQSRVRAISAELEKTNRADPRYLDLVRNEHSIIREENDLASQIRNLEKAERESFAVLSSALRDSHEKERARAEKTKYWSIIGSILGAIIGITGTTVNNHLKMKELRGLVTSAGENSEDLRNLSIQLCESVRAQSQKMDSFLVDLRGAAEGGDNPKVAAYFEKIRLAPPQFSGSELQQQTEKILHALKLQEENLDSEIREIRHLLGLEKSQMLKGDDAVVYVGPEVESMMKRTEENLERKIKYSALASATFVYGALALTLPIIFSFLRGGS